LRYLILLGSPNQRGCDRLGIIASRRLGNAVMRNRAKRRLREVFRHCDSRVLAQPDTRTLDLVAIPRRELVAAPFTDIQSEFQTALRRLRAMRSA
jgi:ribonuclease P protein component